MECHSDGAHQCVYDMNMHNTYIGGSANCLFSAASVQRTAVHATRMHDASSVASVRVQHIRTPIANMA